MIINTNLWKEFYVRDIFETQKVSGKLQVPTGASVSKIDLQENGDIPRISVTGINNGIQGYYDYIGKSTDNYRVYSNFISVSFLGTVFYQEKICSLDMKVHCLKPMNFELNKNIGLFLASVIKKSIQNNSYADQISSTTLPFLKIKLPVDVKGNVDLLYMENMIKQSFDFNRIKLSKLGMKTYEKNIIDVSNWKRFHLYDIFEIDPGTKLDKTKMHELKPQVNFVGRSGVNNGVTAKVDLIDGLIPYKAGTLTLSLGGAYLGSCFVQKEQYYTSQNVNVLIPKQELSFKAKLFISAVIFKEGNIHYKAFIDELNRHVKTDFTIPLPVTEDEKPDYNKMEKYMEKIMMIQKEHYNIIKSNCMEF